MDQLLLPVLLGTNRKQRLSVHPAKWLLGEMEKRAEIQTRLFDVSEFARMDGGLSCLSLRS